MMLTSMQMIKMMSIMMMVMNTAHDEEDAS